MFIELTQSYCAMHTLQVHEFLKAKRLHLGCHSVSFAVS